MLTKKRILWSISIVLVLLISLLVFLLVYLPYQVFDHKPIAFPEKKLDAAAIATLSAKVQKLMPNIMNSKPEDVLTLELTEAETNTVLLFAENGQSYHDVFSGNMEIETKTNKPYVIFFQDGAFNVFICHRLELFKIFDEYINIKFSIKPHIQDGKSKIKIRYFKAGNISIPRRILQSYFEEEMVKANNTTEYQMLAPLLKEVIITEQNELRISFKPFRLKQIVMQFLLK